MVNKKPFFDERVLGESLNSNFWGPSIVKRDPSERTVAYRESKRRPDICLIHGAPDEYEMNTRFFGGESDLIFLSEDYDLSDTSLITFAEEYSFNQELYLEIEEELDVDIIVPEKQPDSTIDDWKAVMDLASPSDHIRSYTSGYHSYKARKIGEWTLEDADIEVFGVPTDRDTIWNQIIQNTDTHTRNWIKSKL